MKKSFKRSLMLIILIFALILGLGFASASNEINQNNDINYVDYHYENIALDSLDSGLDNADGNIDSSDSNLENNEIQLDLESSSKHSSQKLQSDYTASFKDIQSMIDNAKENDTIILSGTYRGDSQIIVDRTVNLKSDTGAVLDGRLLTKIMLVNASYVIIEGISFINSNYTGLELYSDHITVKDCSFQNCINGELGSALVCQGNYLNVLNSNFTDNVANKSSCHHTDGAAIYLIGSNCNIGNCSFQNNWGYNYETASSGGAIWLKGKNINISDSLFVNNSARSKFGWTLHGEEETYLADGYGGAIYIVGTNVSIVNSVFEDSLSHAQGGALYYKSSYDCSIVNSTFVNSSSVGEGGVIYLGQNVYGLDIVSSRFIGNTANGLDGVLVKYGDEGSVIYAGKFSGDVRISNSTLLDNKGTSSIYFLGSDLNISGSVIENRGLSTAVIYQNGSLNGNFWDRNFVSSDEFEKSALIVRDGTNQAPDDWFNLILDGPGILDSRGEYDYNLSFVLTGKPSNSENGSVDSSNSSTYSSTSESGSSSSSSYMLPDFGIVLNKTSKNLLSPDELSLKDNSASFKYNYIKPARDTVSIYDDFGNLILSKEILCGLVYPKDSGNDTKDLRDAIDSAPEGSLILLSNRSYVLDTIYIKKDIAISGDGNSRISLSNASDCIFNIAKTDDAGAGYLDYEVCISGIDFILENGDIVAVAEAANDSGPMAIDVVSIAIAGNSFSSSSDDVAPQSITVLRLDSDRAVLAPTGTINISDNTLEAGMKPFDFNVRSIFDGSDVQIPAGGNLEGRKASAIIYEDMVTNAISAKADPRSGEYFNIILKDADGNAISGKFVQIGFNGVIYDRTTDEMGMASLQINLGYKGVYTFAISYLGDDEYKGSFAVAKITVNPQTPRLTASSKSYRASAKTKTLTAAFKTVKGTAIVGKAIRFTVNGKSYSAKTDSKGVATVKVSLNRKGTYSFTAKYAGDNTFAAVSARGKLTIK